MQIDHIYILGEPFRYGDITFGSILTAWEKFDGTHRVVRSGLQQNYGQVGTSRSVSHFLGTYRDDVVYQAKMAYLAEQERAKEIIFSAMYKLGSPFDKVNFFWERDSWRSHSVCTLPEELLQLPGT